ncbi:MAG TPA: hypothetical protein VFQ43_07360, partial [Nitrososphaera sp.]|nr:hypothetical protein [Nitrososphaera sp.]
VGRASARTFSSDSTSAERLSDWRNARREENKELVPSRVWLVLEFAPNYKFGAENQQTRMNTSDLSIFTRVCL